VEPTTAIAIACIAGGICQAAVALKRRFEITDSPEPFGIQGVGGLAGALLTGVFAQKALNHAGADGALFGNLTQLAVQAVACVATGAYAAVVTFVILKLIDASIGLRVPAVVELPEPAELNAVVDLASDSHRAQSPEAAA
jgi:Amt family ammonium transporter